MTLINNSYHDYNIKIVTKYDLIKKKWSQHMPLSYDSLPG